MMTLLWIGSIRLENDNTCCNLHNPPAHSLGDYVKKKEEDFNNAKQNKAKLFISYNTT